MEWKAERESDWFNDQKSDKWCVVDVEADEAIVISLDEPTARLIAAAPEMLKALAHIMKDNKPPDEGHKVWDKIRIPTDEECSAAFAALAKAKPEGE